MNKQSNQKHLRLMRPEIYEKIKPLLKKKKLTEHECEELYFLYAELYVRPVIPRIGRPPKNRAAGNFVQNFVRRSRGKRL